MNMQEDDVSKKNNTFYKSLIDLREKKKFNKKNLKIIQEIQETNQKKFVIENFKKLSITVQSLELSVRSLNCLINIGIKDIGELIQLSENYLLKSPNFGNSSLVEIKNILKFFDLDLGTTLMWPSKQHNNKEINKDRDYLEDAKKIENETKLKFISENFGKLSMNINDIAFNVRTQNCLNNLSIVDVGELIQLSENYLLKSPNFGRKSLSEIKGILKNIDLSLDTEIEWPPKNYKSLKKNQTQNIIININPISNQAEEIKIDDRIIDKNFISDLIKSSLKDREYLVIKKRFWDGETLEKIGQDEKVTRERIRQIESKAVKKLQKHRLIFNNFLKYYKNEIFYTYSCTPELVTKKSLSKIKNIYPFNDFNGLIHLSIEIIYEGSYGASHVIKQYSFFEKNFNSIEGAWYKKDNISDLENNTDDLIYFLDKKPLPRQCENARILLKLSKNDFMNSFHLALNNTNYYMIGNYLCKNSHHFSNVSNRYVIRMHEVLFNASPNTLLKNEDVMKLIRSDNFLNNCPYSSTILRAKELMRGKGYIKTNHLFYITGAGIIPLGVEQNNNFSVDLMDLEASNESVNDEEDKISFKLEKYLNIIEEILMNHKALSISEISKIYAKKIDQNIKPEQTIHILGILLSSYSKFIQIGPGVWSLKITPYPVDNLVNFIINYKSSYAVDIYTFLKYSGENLSHFTGFNENFEQKICIDGKDILEENSYQSLLNISEPSKWKMGKKIINKFQDLKKISNFYLKINHSGSLNINNEKKIKSYNINNLGYSILYIYQKESASVVGLNYFFDYSLFWNTSIFNLALLSFADLIDVPKNNLQAHKVKKINISDLQKLVLDELIEYGNLNWNRKFGKKIISLIMLNYENFIKKDNWITENLLLHDKI